MSPLFLEPEVGECVPFEQFVVRADAIGCNLVFHIFWLVGGEDVGEEGKGNNDANEEKFFQEQENNGEKEGNREDCGIELAGAGFIGAGGGGPFK